MDLPEKLFKDFHYQLLLNKKNNQECNSVSTLRHLISLSDVQCSQQNMSEKGLEGYKSELFAEYFKLMDHGDYQGLLPLPTVDSDKNESMIRNSNGQYSYNECLNKFVPFLKSLGNLQLKYSKTDSTLSGQKDSINFFGSTKHSKASVGKFSTLNTASSHLNRTSEHIKQRPFANSGHNSNANRMKKFQTDAFAGPSSISPRPSMKNRFEELTDTSSKKKCVSSEPKSSDIGFMSANKMYRNPLKKSTPSSEGEKTNDQDFEPKNEAFKNFDKKIVDIVLNEIMDFSPNVKWTDIAGLEFVKTTVQEIVIWPLLRPDIFTGLRAPPRGILLFGPPGTGKTLIGKCIATESNSTFFCISASSLASKWVGESEQMVRVLFAAARLNQPAVIFIDEIDSLLSQRSDKDQDFTRKLKTEFLVQFDGAKTNSEERVLVVGATNRPHELDEAARRRFVKRLFVPLPDESARKQIIQKLLGTHRHDLSPEDLQQICKETEGYSGSDVAHLCKEAAMGPIRSIGPDQITTVSLDQVRSISLLDFKDALRQVRASVVADDMNYYIEWNKKFGSFGIPT